jgi:hypothetical protein
MLRWTRFPDWRLRDVDGTRELIEAPIHGLLFDIERNKFWWHSWGDRRPFAGDSVVSDTITRKLMSSASTSG